LLHRSNNVVKHAQVSTPRVFIGPIEVDGYYANLAEGFRKLGVPCTYFTFKSHPFGYGGESPRHWLLILEDRIDSIRLKLPLPGFLMRILGIPSVLLRILWICVSILSHDVFIFGYVRCLAERSKWDLRLIKLLKKKNYH
jgi:hypothetical protein